MPNLVCSVENCANNEDCLCALNEISVCGCEAQTSDNTCCASFREESESFSNCAGNCGCATASTEVACQAHNCTHNEDDCCCADSINVCGCGAKRSEGTECSSFVPE